MMWQVHILLTSPVYRTFEGESKHQNKLWRGDSEDAMTPRPHSIFEDMLITPRWSMQI